MVLYLIGLGLGDEKDVTVKGQEAIEKCDKLFLEAYTSILGVDPAKLEETYGKPVEIADRNLVESEAEDRIIKPAAESNVALLVVGDALCATTHTDFVLRARELGITVVVVHNASIMTAIGATGLQLYSFGKTVSIPFFRDDWRPQSFYDGIKFNQTGSLHTLCLLDIKVKEPDFEAMVMGKTAFLPPRFMTVNTALEQLMEVEETRGEGVLSKDTLCVGVARMGQPTEQMVAGTIEELLTVDFGEPLHSLVIVGEVHDLEKSMIDSLRLKPAAEAEAASSGAGAGSSE